MVFDLLEEGILRGYLTGGLSEMKGKILNWAKLVVVLLTVFTITTLFMGALPSIMEWQVVKDYPYMPYIYVLVVIFWVLYLVYWAVKDIIKENLEKKDGRI